MPSVLRIQKNSVQRLHRMTWVLISRRAPRAPVRQSLRVFIQFIHSNEPICFLLIIFETIYEAQSTTLLWVSDATRWLPTSLYHCRSHLVRTRSIRVPPTFSVDIDYQRQFYHLTILISQWKCNPDRLSRNYRWNSKSTRACNRFGWIAGLFAPSYKRILEKSLATRFNGNFDELHRRINEKGMNGETWTCGPS